MKSIQNGFKAALRRASIQSGKIHQLRQTAAVRLLSAGQPVEKVSQYMGHSNPAVTYKVYARFLPEHLTDAAEVLKYGRFNDPMRTLRIARN
ncbi:tyrosine-type recombinase/integrase [Roseinatronobacter monicus]|uniref:tyrosine-type recombinase/integrase n=1 Tax=Roseinatronobacter monicus TaxID=393481 RepID=UPI001FEC1851|nr:tyrosine-type recombinase/integrase [Roseinatronobacter monicus]